MKPNPDEQKKNVADLVERAANAKQEAEYFQDLGLDESARLREQEAKKYEEEAASATADLSGMQ